MAALAAGHHRVSAGAESSHHLLPKGVSPIPTTLIGGGLEVITFRIIGASSHQSIVVDSLLRDALQPGMGGGKT